MSRSIEIPDELYEQAAELAEAAGTTAGEFVVKALREQIDWKRYSIMQADKEKRRFAGVQERMPDSDIELE